jgi:hypothetical protein
MKEWYKKYRQKKFYAMSLVMDKGVKDVSVLENALISLIVVEKMRKLAEAGDVDRDLISIKVDSASKEIGGCYSMFAKDDFITRSTAILTLIAKGVKFQNELTRTNRRIQLTPEQRKLFEDKVILYKDEFKEAYNTELELVNMYIEYESIGRESFVKKKLIEICNRYNIEVNEK